MDVYRVGQLWNRAASLFSRKTYQGISRHGRDDDQVELVDPNASSSHNLRAKSSTFSIASSLTSSTFSTIRHHPTFASKFSNKKRSISNEDVTLLEIGASGISRGGEGGSHSSSPPPPPYGKSGENTDVETLPTERDSISTQREKQWINGVYLCAKAGAVVFIINLTFIGIAAGLASRFPDNESFGNSAVIYRGDCGISKRWDTALHMIINVLSTCILAASNYCMQTLVAPTREEIDSHHAVWKWLDIGSASVKNLFAIEKYRLVLWLVLMLTATPFHLM